MRQVRPLTPTELEKSITIMANAYPGLELNKPANRARYQERLATVEQNPDLTFYGHFEAGQMRGIMRWHNFTMNYFGAPTLVGGVGAIAVDLLHKKEKVAAEMMQAFLQHYKEAGSSLVTLYPFRPDFYRRMGFGYGTPLHHFRFLPAAMSKGDSRADLVFLNKHDRDRLHACYHDYFRRTHGIMTRRPQFWERVLDEPGTQIVGVSKDGRLSGYLSFSFEKGQQDNFLSNNLVIRELVYETIDDLLQLSTYIHTQADQFDAIIYNTQDDTFFYLLQDPRMVGGDMFPYDVAHDSSRQGLGIMYRVIDVSHLFEALQDHNFNDVTCCCQIRLNDSFFPENAGDYTVAVQGGKAQLAPEATPEVTLTIDVADFSSLVLGVVDLGRLIQYGLAELSDETYHGRLQRMFSGPKPVCLTTF